MPTCGALWKSPIQIWIQPRAVACDLERNPAEGKTLAQSCAVKVITASYRSAGSQTRCNDDGNRFKAKQQEKRRAASIWECLWICKGICICKSISAFPASPSPAKTNLAPQEGSPGIIIPERERERSTRRKHIYQQLVPCAGLNTSSKERWLCLHTRWGGGVWFSGCLAWAPPPRRPAHEAHSCWAGHIFPVPCCPSKQMSQDADNNVFMRL